MGIVCLMYRGESCRRFMILIVFFWGRKVILFIYWVVYRIVVCVFFFLGYLLGRARGGRKVFLLVFGFISCFGCRRGYIVGFGGWGAVGVEFWFFIFIVALVIGGDLGRGTFIRWAGSSFVFERCGRNLRFFLRVK